MSGLYTDSHKRYSKKIFSQTANPMRRNLKHGIAQHIWNYACVVDIQLHCNVSTHIYIYHLYLHTSGMCFDAAQPHIIWIIKYIYVEHINCNLQCRCMCASFRNKEAVFVYAVILPSSHIRKCVCTPNVEGLKSYPNCTLLLLRQRLKINKKASKWNKQKRFFGFFCVSTI